MPIFKVIILAIVQGLAELLPVSSSAHVVVAEKLMRLDPSSPAMTLLLVMLHTGTMFAVIVYFWKQWKKTFFSSADAFKRFAIRAIWATLLTGVIGEIIIKTIEHTAFKGMPKAEIELLFGRLDLIAPALLAAGILIIIAGLREKSGTPAQQVYGNSVTMRQAGWIGAVQGLCMPFRGFSRSGATISTGMIAGATKDRAERFSFALAVILTPPVVAREALRLVKASHEAAAVGTPVDLGGSVVTGLLGAVFAFLAGLVACAGSARGSKRGAGTCSVSTAWWLRASSSISTISATDHGKEKKRPASSSQAASFLAQLEPIADGTLFLSLTVEDQPALFHHARDRFSEG